MPRPPKWRCLNAPITARFFMPSADLPADMPSNRMSLDGLEVLRLLDLEGLSQEEAATVLGVSRSSVSRTASKARRALVEAIWRGEALTVEGGPVAVLKERRQSARPGDSLGPKEQDVRDGTPQENQGEIMVIAVPHESGSVNQHFGRTREFLVTSAQDGAIQERSVYEVPGMQHNHSALAGFLQDRGVDVILAGGMGAPMREALERSGFEVICGVSGLAEDAVGAYLRGEVEPGPATCGHHHGEAHVHGEHHHGEGGCNHGAGAHD